MIKDILVLETIFLTGVCWENVNNQYDKLYAIPGVKPQKVRNKIVEILKGFRGNDKRYIGKQSGRKS